MSYLEVISYSGEPDQIFMLGDGMAVAIYELLDESTIVLKFSSPSKIFRESLESGVWKLKYANRTMSGPEATQEFIK